MATSRQKLLSFVSKNNKFYRVKGKGLISPSSSLDHRFKRMTLGAGTPAHKWVNGGTIKNNNRPYQLKDSATIQPKASKAFAPIVFRL